MELLNSHSFLNSLHSVWGLHYCPATSPINVTSDFPILKYSGQVLVLILIYRYYLIQHSFPLLWLFSWLSLGYDSLLVSFCLPSCLFSISFVAFLYSDPLMLECHRAQSLDLFSIFYTYSLGNLIYSLGFKDNFYIDCSQIYISNLHLSPEFSTQTA